MIALQFKIYLMIMSIIRHLQSGHSVHVMEHALHKTKCRQGKGNSYSLCHKATLQYLLLESSLYESITPLLNPSSVMKQELTYLQSHFPGLSLFVSLLQLSFQSSFPLVTCNKIPSNNSCGSSLIKPFDMSFSPALVSPGGAFQNVAMDERCDLQQDPF